MGRGSIKNSVKLDVGTQTDKKTSKLRMAFLLMLTAAGIIQGNLYNLMDSIRRII
jgi:hypothetical protein